MLVVRHVVILNPAASVRAERYAVVEGKTPEIAAKQARDLLKSVDASNLVGLRDRAIIAVLIYTAARVGAVAKLTLKSFKHDGTQYALRFSEKGGKSREIPVRHDLEQFLLDYIEAARITEGPLFRTAVPPDEAADGQGDERHRHLPDDEAAAQGRGAAGAVLAPLVPRGDGHGPAGAERAAGGRAAPGRPRRPAHDAALRPAAEEGHAEHRGADLDLTLELGWFALRSMESYRLPEARRRWQWCISIDRRGGEAVGRS